MERLKKSFSREESSVIGNTKRQSRQPHFALERSTISRWFAISISSLHLPTLACTLSYDVPALCFRSTKDLSLATWETALLSRLHAIRSWALCDETPRRPQWDRIIATKINITARNVSRSGETLVETTMERLLEGRQDGSEIHLKPLIFFPDDG